MIILAPLHGYTDVVFRNVYARHYQGIDIAVSPFVSLTHGDKINPRKLRDLLPEHNVSMPVIPQILGKEPELFIQMADYLYDWGYETINWNLGCPIKGIAKNDRGSGLLTKPDLLKSILDKIVPGIKQKLSLKIRLGYFDADEIFALIPIFNNYPLADICIHPRIGMQMYEGEIMHDVLLRILPEFKAEIIYNGDIFNLKDYKEMQKKYPSVNQWMLGRGVFYNPLLPIQIKRNDEKCTETEELEFSLFLLDLYQELQINKSEHQALNKIKDHWHLFSMGFENRDEVLNRIIHADNIAGLIETSNDIVLTEKRKLSP
ncbi:MAG: tRNA-dihydrouridine synthase family protein [Bacteroidetes bacterium]|nr:tRNA-dihydrouridine synthase family protein [Bacteroidota bacterium]